MQIGAEATYPLPPPIAGSGAEPFFVRRHPISRPLLLSVVLVGAASPGGPARAFDGPSLEARGSVGAGSMLSQAQRDQGYHSGFVPDLHPGLRVSDMFAAELALASWFFPRDGGLGTGRATLLGGGLRFDPRVTSWLTWFLDAHAGLALTGGDNRFMVDGGTGLDVWFKRNLAVGPYVRYGHILDAGPDPMFWAAALCATVTLATVGDEPPALGGRDPEREERQKAWEKERRSGRQASRYSDRDGDGITDEHDICPDEKPGSNPDPNMQGCPRQESHRAESATRRTELAPPSQSGGGDRDGDGVPDKDDKCPNRPFGNMPDPMAMGCPLPEKDRPRGGMANIQRGMIVLSRPIQFSGRDDINASRVSALRDVANLLQATPGIKTVSIEGHTDSSMPALQSLELSEQRAESVKRWLVSNGVEAERLRIRGHGDTQPVASNRTAKGRAANSRIELIIVDPPGGQGL